MKNVNVNTAEIEDVRVTFLKHNNQYVAFDVCDVSYFYTNNSTPLKLFIERYVRSVGFETIPDYLKLLPGFSGKEILGIQPPFIVFEMFEKINTEYDYHSEHQICTFDFEYSLDDIERDQVRLLRYLSKRVSDDLFGDMNILLTVVPTLEELRPLFYNISDEKLWFCKEVLLKGK